MPANLSFFLVALITLTASAAAMRLRNLVHCALCAALAFGGLAISYLLLDAEFVALAQLLIYVGAVAILIVFGIMLTRGAEIVGDVASCGSRPWIGLIAAGLLCAMLLLAAISVPTNASLPPLSVAPSVRQIGTEMMSLYIVPLEVIGLLLTAALIGAVVLAVREGAPAKSQAAAREPISTAGPPPAPLELQLLNRG